VLLELLLRQNNSRQPQVVAAGSGPAATAPTRGGKWRQIPRYTVNSPTSYQATDPTAARAVPAVAHGRIRESPSPQSVRGWATEATNEGGPRRGMLALGLRKRGV